MGLEYNRTPYVCVASREKQHIKSFTGKTLTKQKGIKSVLIRLLLPGSSIPFPTPLARFLY
jgi:hypothetical protein